MALFSKARGRLTGGMGLLVLLAAFSVAVHLFSNVVFPFGIFRDEFYYIACSQRLAWGYVDHPPLIALITLITRALFDDSIVGLRLFPALAGAVLIFLAGWMARQLGGGRFAQALAAIAALSALYWIIFGFLSTIGFDHLFWVLTAFLVLRLLQTENPKYWLAIGAAVGLGLMTKNNMAFLTFGLACGVLVSHRNYLRGRWLWLGALLAFVIVSPYLVWELQNGAPTLEFIRNASIKNATLSPLEFIVMQILVLNPFTLPIWLAGLIFYMRSKKYRLLAWMYLVPLAIFVATQAARADYLTPAYIWLLPAGAVVIEQWIERRKWQWLKPLALGALVVSGLLLLPLGTPVLPVADTLAYAQAAGFASQPIEKTKTALLPEWYADRFGWQEMVAALAQVYQALPPADRAQAVFFTANYGEAGAINFYGAKEDLPPALSGHNNYYLWGPDDASGAVVIVIGFRNKSDFGDAFARVEQVGTFTCQYCRSDENDLPIWVARGLKQPLPALWSQVKHYD